MRFTEACLLKTENNMTTLSEPLVTPKYGKWRQLVLGLICMAAISSPQYVWTLLTKPLAAKLGVGLPELQVTFSLLIILQTFFSPFQGRLVENDDFRDPFRPRRLPRQSGAEAAAPCCLPARQSDGGAEQQIVYFPGNAAPAAVLADVRHDGDDVDFRADGHFADGGVRRGFRH